MDKETRDEKNVPKKEVLARVARRKLQRLHEELDTTLTVSMLEGDFALLADLLQNHPEIVSPKILKLLGALLDVNSGSDSILRLQSNKSPYSPPKPVKTRKSKTSNIELYKRFYKMREAGDTYEKAILTLESEGLGSNRNIRRKVKSGKMALLEAIKTLPTSVQDPLKADYGL